MNSTTFNRRRELSKQFSGVNHIDLSRENITNTVNLSDLLNTSLNAVIENALRLKERGVSVSDDKLLRDFYVSLKSSCRGNSKLFKDALTLLLDLSNEPKEYNLEQNLAKNKYTFDLQCEIARRIKFRISPFEKVVLERKEKASDNFNKVNRRDFNLTTAFGALAIAFGGSPISQALASSSVNIPSFISANLERIVRSGLDRLSLSFYSENYGCGPQDVFREKIFQFLALKDNSENEKKLLNWIRDNSSSFMSVWRNSSCSQYTDREHLSKMVENELISNQRGTSRYEYKYLATTLGQLVVEGVEEKAVSINPSKKNIFLKRRESLITLAKAVAKLSHNQVSLLMDKFFGLSLASSLNKYNLEVDWPDNPTYTFTDSEKKVSEDKIQLLEDNLEILDNLQSFGFVVIRECGKIDNTRSLFEEYFNVELPADTREELEAKLESQYAFREVIKVIDNVSKNDFSIMGVN